MPRQRRIRPGGTRGTVFKEVSRIRLEDAAVLLSGRRLRGAIYLSGYAVECALKWAITARMAGAYLPATLEIHDWNRLLREAQLAIALRKDELVAGIFSELADIWGPELRYLSKEPTFRQTELLYNQCATLYRWIIEHAL